MCMKDWKFIEMSFFTHLYIYKKLKVWLGMWNDIIEIIFDYPLFYANIIYMNIWIYEYRAVA